jgi:hypothetical protein
MANKDIVKEINDEFKKRVEQDISLPITEALISIIENEQGEKDDVVVNDILKLFVFFPLKLIRTRS